MPTILRLHLIPLRDVTLRPESGPAQGWFLTLARRWDPAWAGALHGGNRRPPYSLSPLHRAAPVPLSAEDRLGGDETRNGGGSTGLFLRRGEPVAMRLSFADDERVRGLLAALPGLPLPLLGSAPCRLARLPRPDQGDPDWLHAPWDVLINAPPATRLRVSFETPTAFSHRGESLLLPDPAHLLDSWRRAWGCAPSMPAGTEGITADGLRIAEYALHTEPLSLKGGLRIGFVGTLDLAWRPGTPPETRRAFAALAGLADFLGTGAKTALGMGQTRVLVSDDE